MSPEQQTETPDPRFQAADPPCDWCGESSVSKIKLEGGRLPKWAYVCAEHEERFAAEGALSERRVQEEKRVRAEERRRSYRRWRRW